MITSFYFSILALFYLFLTSKVIKARRVNRISLGSGGNNEILNIVSAHNNFSNYVGLFLIGLIILELNQTNKIFLHCLGMSFIVGRALHFYALNKNEFKFLKIRVLGMMLTLIPIAAMAVFNLHGFIS